MKRCLDKIKATFSAESFLSSVCSPGKIHGYRNYHKVLVLKCTFQAHLISGLLVDVGHFSTLLLSETLVRWYLCRASSFGALLVLLYKGVSLKIRHLLSQYS